MKIKFEYSSQEVIRVPLLNQLSFAEFNDEEERQMVYGNGHKMGLCF